MTKPFENLAGWDEETFRRAVSRNLKAGDFRLFIAVDEMTEKLKKRLNRTVTFLNSQLPKVQFLAVAVPRGGPVEVYGDDPEAIPPLEPKLKADRWTLIEEISSPDAALVAEGLFDWADSMRSRGVRVRPHRNTRHHQGASGSAVQGQAREVQVSLSAIVGRGEPWDERTEQLVQDLDEIGVRLEGQPADSAP